MHLQSQMLIALSSLLGKSIYQVYFQWFISLLIRSITQSTNSDSEVNDKPQLGNANLSGLSDNDSDSQAENEVPNAGPSLPSVPNVGSLGCKDFTASLQWKDILTSFLTIGNFTQAVETRSGRKWRVVAAEDIYGGCLWDHTPTKAEINAGVALKCAYAGCKTGWVHTQFSSILRWVVI